MVRPSYFFCISIPILLNGDSLGGLSFFYSGPSCPSNGNLFFSDDREGDRSRIRAMTCRSVLCLDLSCDYELKPLLCFRRCCRNKVVFYAQVQTSSGGSPTIVTETGNTDVSICMTYSFIPLLMY